MRNPYLDVRIYLTRKCISTFTSTFAILSTDLEWQCHHNTRLGGFNDILHVFAVFNIREVNCSGFYCIGDKLYDGAIYFTAINLDRCQENQTMIKIGIEFRDFIFSRFETKRWCSVFILRKKYSREIRNFNT